MAIEGPERRRATMGRGRPGARGRRWRARPTVRGRRPPRLAGLRVRAARACRGGLERGDCASSLPSRSGYAGSSRDEGRDVAAAAARHRGSCSTRSASTGSRPLGWSGGGPARARVRRASSPAAASRRSRSPGVAPYLPGEFDWTEGMAEENVDEFALALEAGPAYDEMLADVPRAPARARARRRLDPHATCSAGSSSDRGRRGDDARGAARPPREHGRRPRPGVGGWRDDDQAFLRALGVRRRRDRRARRRSGSATRTSWCPRRHGEWLAANVRGRAMRRFPDEGHLSIMVGSLGELLDGLVELAGGPW